jgi:hypothetical protein
MPNKVRRNRDKDGRWALLRLPCRLNTRSTALGATCYYERPQHRPDLVQGLMESPSYLLGGMGEHRITRRGPDGLPQAFQDDETCRDGQCPARVSSGTASMLMA